MKLAVMASGKQGLEAEVDSRFGRAPYFVVVDSESMESSVHKNKAASESGGAGIAAAQAVLDEGVQGVIAGNFGPKAFEILNSGEVKLFALSEVTIKEALEKFNQGKVEELSNYTSSAHSGLN